MKILIQALIYLYAGLVCLEANESIFTQEEKLWIQEHPTIMYGSDPSWDPFDYINYRGKHKGISQDYLQEVSRISGLKFSLYAKKEWSEVMKDIKAKKVDLVPAVYDSEQRRKYLHYSASYLKLAEYIFTKKDVKKIMGYKDISGKSIAVVEGYAVVSWLKQNHPSIQLVIKKNLFECVQAVSSGDVYGFISDIPSTNRIEEKYFVTNIKANRIIPDRDPLDLYMAVRKDYPLLASIITKSLAQISQVRKESIFSKYAKSSRKKGLRAAFGFGRPPYMYDKNSGKGIEETLVRLALENRGISLLEVRQMPILRGQKIVIDNPEIDFSVGVIEDKNDGLFYSDNFVKYENIAITRASDKLQINSIQDLSGKKVVAWDKAYEMLGPKFNKIFKPQSKPDNYTEVFDQKIQHKKFFLKEADVILVDKNIFKWYVNKYSERYDADQKYEMHYIFSKPTWIKISFRDKALRDEFNLGLKAIKDNGIYENIISDFLKIDLQKQLDLVQLISSLSADYIFENNIKGLTNILSKFKTIKIIRGIEFISKSKQSSILKLANMKGQYKEVKAFTWGKAQMGMIHKPSFLYEDGSPVEVGSVKVYYKIDNFKEVDISYIPDMKNFKSLKEEEYKQVKKIYKQLGLALTSTKLSVTEQKWIQEHSLIRFVGDPNWLPFEAFNKKGEYIGIVSEYLKEIEQITGLKFKRIQTSSWEESVNAMKEKKADMISETTDSKMRSYLSFTNAYLQNHIVIVMDAKEKYVDNLSLIQEKKIVVIKDYGYVAKIKESYPNINFLEAEDISSALNIISSGQADALLCTMALGAYHIEKDGFINLRIVGKTEFSTSVGYGIQPEMQVLVGILNKSILTLDEGRKQEILKKWTVQRYVEKIDYTLVWQILGAAFILFGLFWYWNRKMKKEISLRLVAENELKEANEMVKDSIQFSSMIQKALMPTKQSFQEICPEYFTIWEPRDIVGGDIYFIEELRHDQEIIIMMIDCTGHGVPGAFVTMLVKAIERNVIGHIKASDEEVSPSKILSVFNSSMKHLLKQENKDALSNAGFDAAIVYINKKTNTFIYAGAEIPLYYLDCTDHMQMIKGNRHSVGYRTSKLAYIFKDHNLKLDEIKRFYLSTDGYIDQNGGNKGFSFGKKRFVKLLEESKDLNMDALKQKLLEELRLYQGKYERNDDIALIGIELSRLFQSEKVILEYKGLITQEKLCIFLGEVEAELSETKIAPKVLAILTEQMQNVMSYTKEAFKESAHQHKSKGHVILGFDGTRQKYFAYASNLMNKDDEGALRKKLEKINSLDIQELKAYYKELRRTGDNKHKRGAGLGFLEMAKRSSESLEYNISKTKDKNYTFEIKVYI